MLKATDEFLLWLVSVLWGLPTVIILISGGLFFSLLLRGVQFRAFFHAIEVVRGKFDNPDDPGEISHFKALCAALSGTVGLGNIAGVAVAIHVGGPGATVWMIVAGLLGMVTKYVECSLSVLYRKVDSNGVVHGGPMYYIRQAFGEKGKWFGEKLALFFALCTMFAALGAGAMFQANQASMSFSYNSGYGIPTFVSGGLFAILTGIVIIGGVKRIGAVAGYLVPIMAISYVVACTFVVFVNIHLVPRAIQQIIYGAFLGQSIVGGVAGITFKTALLQGIRRAAFSNEAGFGSAAIAHSAAKTKEPIREGVVALLEPFIDTIVICNMTAIAVIITGTWDTPDKTVEGVRITQAAFDSAYPGLGAYFIPIAVGLFAYSTMISWSYYGERAIDYIFGERAIYIYKVVFCACIFIGSQWQLAPVLNFTDSAVALMIFPNMLAIIMLWRVVLNQHNSYFKKFGKNQDLYHT